MVNKKHQLDFRNFFVLCFILFLCSCSRIPSKDGPPNFYVDETKIPNAVPKAEPLAKYGNYKSYVVLGKRYYTLKSSRNYEEVGTASWYGTKFHARKTSSGERYNMLAMTAAHKTLPLPTYVEVTNLKNQRKVVVKVNDRGPFTNRLIDLSYVAAKKLGMLGHGTTKVRVRAIDANTLGQRIDVASMQQSHDPFFPFLHKRSKPSSNNNGLFIQVGAFKKRGNAEQLRHRLASLLKMPVYVHEPDQQSSLYRVKVGPIRDVLTAHQVSQRLEILGIKSNKYYGA